MHTARNALHSVSGDEAEPFEAARAFHAAAGAAVCALLTLAGLSVAVPTRGIDATTLVPAHATQHPSAVDRKRAFDERRDRWHAAQRRPRQAWSGSDKAGGMPR